MKRILRVFLAAVTLTLAAPCSTTGASLGERIQQAARDLAEITGLELRRPVRYETINRAQLSEFLKKRLRREIKPKEVEIEERLLKKFGLVPADFDLLKTLVALYTEQAAAFYDFHSKKLYLLESGEERLEEMAVVHEVAHALADQHFGLEKFLKQRGVNDDSALARMAVMEGQATWLMSELSVREAGQSLLGAPELVSLMSRMIAVSARGFPVFDTAPLYLQQSLLFPYASGMKFQHEVLKKLGQAGFRKVFEDPPATTQQVLHPEKYFEGVTPEKLPLPGLRPAGAFRELASGMLGEFDYAVLLQQYLGEDAVRQIAPHWQGAYYRFLEHRRTASTVLIQAAIWDSAEVAQQFLKAYRKVLEKKWGSVTVEREEPGEVAGRGPDGRFFLRSVDRRVYLVEGVPEGIEVAWPAVR